MYKKNRLRLKREAISEKRSEMGKRGNEVKRELMNQRAPSKVVGVIKTSGIFGEHTIECLANDDPNHVWMRVDGALKCPRTLDGVVRVLGKWIYKEVVL